MNAQKLFSDLLHKEEVITNPEIKKNISTPKKPLGINSLLKWFIMTMETAKALRPSNSGKYVLFLESIKIIISELGF